jgi:hypothetical protein
MHMWQTSPSHTTQHWRWSSRHKVPAPGKTEIHRTYGGAKNLHINQWCTNLEWSWSMHKITCEWISPSTVYAIQIPSMERDWPWIFWIPLPFPSLAKSHQQPLGKWRIRQAAIPDPANTWEVPMLQSPKWGQTTHPKPLCKSSHVIPPENHTFTQRHTSNQKPSCRRNPTLNRSPRPSISASIQTFPPHLQECICTAISSHKRIGWENLLNSFLSIKWTNLANLDMLSSNKPNSAKGTQRIRTSIPAIYVFPRTLWFACNSVLHAQTQADDALTSARTAENIEVSFYHQRHELLRFDDSHLCDRNLDLLLTGSSSTRHRWLRLIKSSVQLQAINGLH